MSDCLDKLTPAEVIMARIEAFSCGDFGLIYDSYHSESNFRRQFSSREEYIQTGRSSLSQDYRIVACRVIAAEQQSPESRVIFLLEMSVRGESQVYAELVWLRRQDKVWRYHRSLKMTGDQLPDQPDQLEFADFDKLDPATIF